MKGDIVFLRELDLTPLQLDEMLNIFKEANTHVHRTNAFLANKRIEKTAIKAEYSLDSNQVSIIISWAVNKIKSFNPENYTAKDHYQAAIAFGLLTGRRISEIYMPDTQYEIHPLGIAGYNFAKKRKEDDNAGIIPALTDEKLLVDFIKSFPERNKTAKQCNSCASKLSEKSQDNIPQQFREWNIVNHSLGRKFYSSACKVILSSNTDDGLPISNIATHFLRNCLVHKYEKTLSYYIKFNIEMCPELDILKDKFHNYVQHSDREIRLVKAHKSD